MSLPSERTFKLLALPRHILPRHIFDTYFDNSDYLEEIKMHADEHRIPRLSPRALENLMVPSPVRVGVRLWCLLIFVLAAPAVFAQSETGKSALEGRVLDP